MASSHPNSSALSTNFIEVLFRRWGIALILPLLILAMGLSIALFFPRSYQSEARLFLQMGRESLGIDPTAQTGQQLISLQQMGRDTDITSAIDLLTGREVASLVVERLGTEFILNGPPPKEDEKATSNPIAEVLMAPLGGLISAIKSIDPISDREEAIIEIEKNLGVYAERDSTLINLTFDSDSPEGAQQILLTVIDVYREEHLRVHRNAGSHAFFAEQESLLREQLDQAMGRVRQAKNEMGVASIGVRRNNLENQLQAVQLAAYTAEAEQSAAQASLIDLRKQLGELPERMIATRKQLPNAGADLLREQLYGLQVRKMDLKSRYSDSHPLVLAISHQVEAAEEVVSKQSLHREETTDDVNPIHRQLSLEVKQNESLLAGLNAQLKMHSEQDRSIRADLKQLNADEVLLAQLEREKSLLDKKYYQYAENLEQARIDESLEKSLVSSVSIAQKPTFAEKPVSPSKALVGLGSIVLAFAGTGAVLLGLEQLDNRVRSQEVVTDLLELPVLATIPETGTHSRIYSS